MPESLEDFLLYIEVNDSLPCYQVEELEFDEHIEIHS